MANKPSFFHHFVNLPKKQIIMFEKLFLLVKNNAGKAVIENPAIPEKYHEAVINEASSSIIEVLKGQMENGKIKDLVRFFQFSGTHGHALVTTIVNKFANKLNNFYDIDPKSAMVAAKSLIPPVMKQLLVQSKSGEDKEFVLATMLSKLNGNKADLSLLVTEMMLA